MSSSAKRKQKSRQGRSEEEVKAQREKDAQRMRDKRAAQKNAKMDDSKNLEQKTPTEVSSMDESSSLAADDSGFGKNRFLSSCSTMHLRNTHLPVVLILSTETLMDFSFGNVDRHGSSTLRWIGSVASQSFIEYIEFTKQYSKGDIHPDSKEHCSKLFETVDEIDAMTTEKHHEVTLNFANFTELKPFRYKWLHFEMKETVISVLEKWQFGGLSAGKPNFVFS
ncbi:hypothetical protein Ddc_24358 [Ditylenchus destructor]|nr:hypothetical protein Ddc_24358 [Ditylenchus destructor]